MDRTYVLIYRGRDIKIMCAHTHTQTPRKCYVGIKQAGRHLEAKEA